MGSNSSHPYTLHHHQLFQQFSDFPHDDENYNMQSANGQLSGVNQIQRYHLRTNESENNNASNNPNGSLPGFIYTNKNDSYQHHHLSQAHSSAYPSSTIPQLIINQNQSNQQLNLSLNSQSSSFGYPLMSQNLPEMQQSHISSYQNSSNPSSSNDQSNFAFAARLGHNLHSQLLADPRSVFHHMDERNDSINNTMNLSNNDSIVNKPINSGFHSNNLKSNIGLKNNESPGNRNSWSPKNIPSNFLQDNQVSDQMELGNNGNLKIK